MSTETLRPGGQPWLPADQRAAGWAAGAVVALALAAAYGPNLGNLERTWASDPNYSHGYLVAPIAAGDPLAAAGRPEGRPAPAGRARLGGVAVVLAARLAVRAERAVGRVGDPAAGRGRAGPGAWGAGTCCSGGCRAWRSCSSCCRCRRGST